MCFCVVCNCRVVGAECLESSLGECDGVLRWMLSDLLGNSIMNAIWL